MDPIAYSTKSVKKWKINTAETGLHARSLGPGLPSLMMAGHERRLDKMKYKLICYGCGKATDKGYHVLSDDTIYHYCPNCLEDEEAAKENEEIKAIEKF